MLESLVVGLGRIGMGYDLELPADRVLTHARAFSTHPAFRLVGGVDPDVERGRLFEQRYSAPAFTDLGAALRKTRPQVVAVAAPTDQHGDAVRCVLQTAAPLAILCEKPLAHDLPEARAIAAACKEKKCRLYVNYVRRSDPGAVEVKARLDDGRIGHPVNGVAWYSRGLLHNGSHFLNLLRFWLGAVQDFRVIEGGRPLEHGDREPTVRVRFARGTVTFLALPQEHFAHHSVELMAANGRLRYEWGGEHILWHGLVNHATHEGYRVLSDTVERIGEGISRYQWHVAEQLAASLASRPAQICSGSEALETQETISAILKEAA